MPVDTQPEDQPAAVCFHLEPQEGSLAVTVTPLRENNFPWCIQAGAPHFADRDQFKAKAVQAGLTPAVAEDPGRSFNATARQLRELGFSVAVKSEKSPTAPRKRSGTAPKKAA
jgi:hypothetical protein